MSNQFLTATEAAERLRLSVSTLYHMTSARKIPFYKIGQRTIFSEAELEDWIQKRRVAPIAEQANKGPVRAHRFGEVAS